MKSHLSKTTKHTLIYFKQIKNINSKKYYAPLTVLRFRAGGAAMSPSGLEDKVGGPNGFAENLRSSSSKTSSSSFSVFSPLQQPATSSIT